MHTRPSARTRHRECVITLKKYYSLLLKARSLNNLKGAAAACYERETHPTGTPLAFCYERQRATETQPPCSLRCLRAV